MWAQNKTLWNTSEDHRDAKEPCSFWKTKESKTISLDTNPVDSKISDLEYQTALKENTSASVCCQESVIYSLLCNDDLKGPSHTGWPGQSKHLALNPTMLKIKIKLLRPGWSNISTQPGWWGVKDKCHLRWSEHAATLKTKNSHSDSSDLPQVNRRTASL